MNWKHRFYKSKAWKHIRALAIMRDKAVCRSCGEIIIGSPEVHHMVELTESNYIDHTVSLNLDLLETLCHECHDRRHGRFCAGDKVVIVDYELNIDYSRRLW